MVIAFDDAMKAAAKRAEAAVKDTVESYRNNEITDEDDITGFFAGALKSQLNGQVAGLNWSASVLRHRKGTAAEEKVLGADLFIHVSVNTPFRKYSKGVLIQAKRVAPHEAMTVNEHARLVQQCDTMLSHTPAAYVLDYAKKSFRAAPALSIAGSQSRFLYKECNMTSYGFFLNLFKCPIGDRDMTTSFVKDKIANEPDKKGAPTIVEVTANASDSHSV